MVVIWVIAVVSPEKHDTQIFFSIANFGHPVS